MNRFMIILILIILTGLSCREEPTEPPTAEFTLTAEDIGVTDVFFRLRATLSHGPFTLYVKRNSEQIYQSQSTNLTTVDTLLYDDNLLPKQNYTYKAYYTIGGIVQDSSAPMIITTMDTTSHEFTWEIDTLGDGNGSRLRDVFILNDTCIWVVGRISVRDSNKVYNAASWNGQKWRFRQIPVPLCGTSSTDIYELYTIFSFSESDIWFSGGGEIEHWNGQNIQWDCSMNSLLDGCITNLWGKSATNIYAIGLTGTILRYNGNHWQKMESGTDVNLTDIWGSPDGSVVWACGYNATSRKMQLLRYFANQSWEIVYDGWNALSVSREDSLSGRYFGVYTPCRLRIFIGTDAGLYESFYTTKGEAKRYSYTLRLFPEYPYAMRGNDINDIFIVGNNNYIVHYNGNSWRDFTELRHPDGILYSVAVKDNIVVAVGYLYHPWDSKGIVFIGRR